MRFMAFLKILVSILFVLDIQMMLQFDFLLCALSLQDNHDSPQLPFFVAVSNSCRLTISPNFCFVIHLQKLIN